MTFSNFKIVFAFLIVHSATAQDIITISDITFRRSAEIVSNDWGTKDTLQSLITMKEGEPKTILTYYSYKDEGADCNNVFWTIETIAVQNDSLILSSHYLQKSGIDPIPEWRKRIYLVEASGNLELIYDMYKYHYNDEWVEE